MKTKVYTENLNKASSNVVFTIVIMIISFIVGQLPHLPDSIGFGGFIPILTPPLISVFTLILYFISRIFTKKLNWLITLFGGVYNLYEAFDWYLYYKNYK
jgi:predicted histidine transporter YuiF (NhaC family)